MHCCIQRTKTRWGRYRPWILWTALPLAILIGTGLFVTGLGWPGLIGRIPFGLLLKNGLGLPPEKVAWFWAMAGTVQGIVTPDIPDDFPAFRFIEFSTFHGGIIAAVLFLTLGRGMRAYPKSIPRVIGWSLIYMVIAGVADWLLKVNYGFLRAKPGHASLYDLMPAWPWYIPVVVVLALVAVLVCYLPFFLVDVAQWVRKKR